MAEVNDDILAMVREQLRRDPPPPLAALYGRAVRLNPEIRSLLRIPPDSGRRFRLIPVTCSERFRPPIPEHSGRPFRQIPATRGG